MWGQVTKTKVIYRVQGIIPTRVGTSVKSCYGKVLPWDHPHACGDKGKFINSSLRVAGSSPRVWGQACKARQHRAKFRIIPTRVGTRLNAIRNSASQKDHPHACGDKSHAICRIFSGEGSSPRVWGQVTFYLRSKPVHRIIPTRVGTSKICHSG